ncbi:MAG TPA: dihydroorotate dehydrogenase electron transfer subunit [Planctomycetota bacterium]|nr:dihydroorotate dehydrogenase electron transfer subunit [Planctomycetota bacterium]
MATACEPPRAIEHRGVFTGVEEVARRTWRLEIECPAIAAALRPGQFVMIEARDGGDPYLRRAFSVGDVLPGPSGKPERIVLWVAVIGKGTRALSERRAGEGVALLGPLGRPYDLGDPGRPLLLVGGGIGTAPFPLVARARRAAGATGALRAVFGFRDRGAVCLVSEMEALGCPVLLCTDDGSAGREGRVTEHLSSLLAPGGSVLACGPNPMFTALAAALRGTGVPCQVSTEEPMACGTGLCFGCVVPVRDGRRVRWAKSCIEGPTFPIEEIAWDRVRSIH